MEYNVEFMNKFDRMVEIEWDSKEKALKIANKLIDKASNFIDHIVLADFFADSDKLNDKEKGKELFIKALDIDSDDVLGIARAAANIAREDILGDIKLANDFYKKAYALSDDVRGLLNIAYTMEECKVEYFLVEAKKLYAKILKNDDSLKTACEVSEAFFRPEGINDGELARQTLKSCRSKAQSVGDLCGLSKVANCCGDKELALSCFIESISKLKNNEDDEAFMYFILDLFTEISCPNQTKNSVLEPIKRLFSDDDYIDEYIELVGDLDVFPNLATCAMWADNKKFAVEIIQEAEKRTDEAVNRTTQTMYDINDIADFVERDDSYGINDKEWGKILRNKANEIGCDHRKG